MQINDQGTFYIEGEYKAGDIILTAGDWELVADVDGYKKYAFGYEPADFPELITNGTFDTDLAGWGVGSGWAWDNGAATTNLSYGGYLTQTPFTKQDALYQVTFDLVGSSGGAVYINTGNGYVTQLGVLPATGSFTFYHKCKTPADVLGFAGVAGCSVDNVSVKLAHPKSGDTIQLGNGHHKDFRYYPYKLSSADIQELTR
jgi:hypothetical protein